jgi:hypothetical protein
MKKRRILTLVLAVLCASCERSETPAHQPPAAGQAAAPASPTVVHDALPRSVAGVTLGMSLSEVEGKLGVLTCHDNPGGFRVCATGAEPIDDVSHLELYLHHDQVISLSYEGQRPTNVWDYLDRLKERYGRPALTGIRERDKTGRLHELYGWKDDTSLYSVRLIWHDAESGARDLAGLSISLWDRKAYQQWEAEVQQHKAPTPPESEAPPEAT